AWLIAGDTGRALREPCRINARRECQNEEGPNSRAHRLQAPRCGAKTPTGTPCQRPAIRGCNRCRLHGGLSPGGPRGARNGNFKNGLWTRESIEVRKAMRAKVREIRALLQKGRASFSEARQAISRLACHPPSGGPISGKRSKFRDYQQPSRSRLALAAISPSAFQPRFRWRLSRHKWRRTCAIAPRQKRFCISCSSLLWDSAPVDLVLRTQPLVS